MYRKRKGVGSMEDLWDEAILEENQPLKKVLKKTGDNIMVRN